MWHSHLNDMEIPETKRFIPKGSELGTTLSWPNRSISVQIKPLVAFGLPYLLIELFYIVIPVVRTDGRAVRRSVGVRSHDYQIFSDW